MDAPLVTAARALAKGDPLAALPLVALRDDATALALRGVAMAQLGDLTRARRLLDRASRAFGDDRLGHARCEVARVEVALARRDVGEDATELALTRARRVLEAHGDHDNAARAAVLAARRALLAGDVGRASWLLERLTFGPRGGADTTAALAALVAFDVALRRDEGLAAARALERAKRAAERAAVPALVAEVAGASARLARPLARLVRHGEAQALPLEALEAARRTLDVVVDGRTRHVALGAEDIELTRRPVLFGLLAALAAAHPADVPRDALVREVFGARHHHPSLRARLRVEIGRLRAHLAGHLGVVATDAGYRLVVADGVRLGVILPLTADADAAILALLGDGASWSTAAIARTLALGPRTAQRAILALASHGHIALVGRGPSRRVVLRPVEPGATVRFDDPDGGRR